MDLLYKGLELPCLDILLSNLNMNGFGDLINCLQVGRMLSQGTGWDVAIRSTHWALDTMLPSFPWVTREPARLWSSDVHLATPAATSDGESLAVSEYSYREGGELDVFTRQSGLGADEIGIMINRELRAPLALADLKLKTPELGGFLQESAIGCRFFFGYGAGQKPKARYNLFLDRVVFDEGIKDAIVFLVNHNVIDKVGKGGKQSRTGKRYLDEYLTGRGLSLLDGGIKPYQKFKVSTLDLKDRTIKVATMNPDEPIVYSDMQQMWRAADRSFTVAEGDQSFSEAISAGIPMAYHLWPADDRKVHKQSLFDCLVRRSQRHPGVADFLEACAAYPDDASDRRTLKKIIDCCNDEGFLSRYVQFTDVIANECDIETPLRCFVKRHWLRSVGRQLAQVSPELKACFEMVISLEERGGFEQASAATRKMLSQFGGGLRDFNVRWGMIDRDRGSAKERAAVIKASFSSGGAGANRPVAQGADVSASVPDEVLALISGYEQPSLPQVLPPMHAMDATATAAGATAGTARVGASAAAAAGAVPAPPKPPSS